jgi:hypothetical protein
MRESTSALWKVLRSGRPIASVLYEDFAAREQLLELSYLVAPKDFEVDRVEEVDDVFLPEKQNSLILLVPRNEIEAVRRLSARRAELSTRTAPVLLFLLRRGSGLQELAVRRGLADMLREQEVDPEEMDTFEMELERDRFCDEVKQTPEEWLTEWRAGQKADTPANNLLLHQALLLEREQRG